MRSTPKPYLIMYSCLVATWLLCLSLSCSSVDMPLQADVCVYGGSEAAFTAAIQAARMGKKVILIEPTGHPGGMMVEGIAKDIRFGSNTMISGIARELYTNIETHYNRVPQFDSLSWSSKYEPHLAEAKIEELLQQEKQLRIIRKQRIREKEGVEVDQQAIQRIWLEDGTSIQAAVYIDASIEGDLLHQAGVSTATIREGNQAYDETKNGISGTNEYRQFLVAVDPYLVEGDSSSGLLPTIQPGVLGVPGSPDKHIMGFCFRLVLTRDTSNRIPITQPLNYDPATYEIYRRYLREGGNLFKPRVNRPKGKTDLGSWHDLSANLYGENWEYPTGDYATQARIIQHHKDFTQGLIWFLQHDPAVPERTRKNWEGWGLCKDEFMDNGGWPRRLYIRSARRMLSDYVITQHHTKREDPTIAPDPVAIAWWPPDTHHARRIVHQGKAYNEGFIFGGDDWRPFGISWRALLPKESECTNLISPTCVASSYVAYGAIRILPTFMMLGQVAGTAAALAAAEAIDVQAIHYPSLRDRLISDGLKLEIPKDWLYIITNTN